MSELFDSILSDIKQIEKDLDYPTFTYESTDYICIPSDLNLGGKGGSWGFNSDAPFSMTVRLDQFGTGNTPKLTRHITYLGYDLLINKIIKPHKQFIVVECNFPDIKRF